MSDRYLIPQTKRVHVVRLDHRNWWPYYLCGLGNGVGDKEITTKRIPKGTKMCKRCATIFKKRGGRR